MNWQNKWQLIRKNTISLTHEGSIFTIVQKNHSFELWIDAVFHSNHESAQAAKDYVQENYTGD